MTIASRRVRRLTVILGLGLGLAGCAGEESSTAPAESTPNQTALLEVGEMYRVFIDDNKKPPHASKDVMKYGVAFTYGSLALQERKLAAYWGVDLQPESQEVLAYEAEAPESGGLVLLRDGATVKKLSAEEFQAAPKAPGKLEGPPAKKAAKAG